MDVDSILGLGSGAQKWGWQ